ncbi:MAG: tetratricopeptide repeat protein [Defluviitaleaceae bacterium]|nr:tetratricopeptide repeat protein [Defluviitaleaceae bacterium]
MATLSVGEKLFILRTHHGISENEFGSIAGTDSQIVKAVERGEIAYTEVQERRLRKRLRLEGLPLSKEECAVSKEDLYRCRDFIRGGNLTEARKIYESMVNISYLEPCDPDMVLLFRMFEAQMLIAEGDYDTAKDKLDDARDYMDRANKENRYHYNYSLGLLGCFQGDYDSGTAFFEKAYEILNDNKDILPEDDVRLYYNITMCYTYIGKPYKAIFFTDKTLRMYPEDRKVNHHLNLGIGLAINYIKVNRLSEAEKLFDKHMVKAKSTKDGVYIGRVSFGLGYLFEIRENWDLAIDYFNQALKYLPKDTDNYFASLFHKICCIIKNKKFSSAEREINKAQDLCSTNELWIIYFEAIEYYLALSRRMATPNEVACKYIEVVAIPHFRQNHDHFIALEFCKLLSRHYDKIVQSKKASKIKSVINDIYEWIFCW